MLKVIPIKTRIFLFEENLNNFVLESLKENPPTENSILVITSKIVSLAEGRRVAVSSISKEDLIKKEADHYLGYLSYGCHLTIKEGLLIPSAGIDESNSDGAFYILFPKNPKESAKALCNFIKETFKLKNFGVIMSDSHTSPLRRGVTGIALSNWGIQAVKNIVGTKDLFGREIKMTQVNYADALASAAVLTMGEANESCPLALLSCDGVEFEDDSAASTLKMAVEEDLYYPLLKPFLKT